MHTSATDPWEIKASLPLYLTMMTNIRGDTRKTNKIGTRSMVNLMHQIKILTSNTLIRN